MKQISLALFTVIVLMMLASTAFGQLDMKQLENQVLRSATPWQVEALDKVEAPSGVTKFISSRYRDDFFTFLIESETSKDGVRFLYVEVNWLRMPGNSIRVAKEGVLIAMKNGKPKFVSAQWYIPHPDPRLNVQARPEEWFYQNYETVLRDLPPDIQRYFTPKVKTALKKKTAKELARFEKATQ